MNNNLITVAEAAKQKGVSRSAIYKAIEQGRLKSQKILGRLALDKAEVARWQPHVDAGWPKGKRVSDEAKAKISQSQKRRWAARKKTTKSPKSRSSR
jgi:excisionase family DNA binding protein